MVDKDAFLASLRRHVCVFDGAAGTMLQQFTKGCLDELNLTNPEAVQGVHRAYYEAGTRLMLTHSFGASRVKLAKYGLSGKMLEINQAAVRNVKLACPDCLVAGEMGPLGESIEPLGGLSFDEAYEAYREQAAGLLGSDVLIVTTISDIKELKAALMAARDVFSGPIISSMTIQGGRTFTGTDVETYVAVAEALGADIIGVNCSDGPEGMYEIGKRMAASTGKPLCFKPNAGMPKLVDGNTVWDYPVQRFADYGARFVALGAGIVGGCCGTDPEFIRALSMRVKGLRPGCNNPSAASRFSSRTSTVVIKPTVVVGERINPTNRPGFIYEMKQGKTDYIRQQALQQVQEGAGMLDINVGALGVNEEELLPRAIEAAQSVTSAPLVIDTTDLRALEAALKAYAGKPLINSVNGSEKSMREVLPLAKRYGAGVIALCLDEQGLPKGVQGRLRIAERIVERAVEMGIPRQDIVVDGVVLTLATNPDIQGVVLETIERLRAMGLTTILGLSNISHGLPGRAEINSKFFTEASKRGLGAAIMNPIHSILFADTTIHVDTGEVSCLDYSNLPVQKQLLNAVVFGDKENITKIVEKGLEKLSPLEVNGILIDAIQEVGRQYDGGGLFLPRVLRSAEAMKLGFNRLKLEMGGAGDRGAILFATVENDIHDIGKNIVMTLAESNNYRVIDLGVNVAAERIVEAAIEHSPEIIALSALMTTTAPQMEEVVRLLREKNINTPVIIGGAVITEDFADRIHTHFGKDALEGVRKINELMRKCR